MKCAKNFGSADDQFMSCPKLVQFGPLTFENYWLTRASEKRARKISESSITQRRIA